MTKSGYTEAARRGITLVFLTAGPVQFWHSRSAAGWGCLAAALVTYIFLPRIKKPENALCYSLGAAVIGPDFLGFMLTAFFTVLPFFIGIPGTFIMFLPMALVSSLILFFSTWYACFWLLTEPDALVISTPMKERRIPFKHIKRVASYRRGLPGWMKKLAPFLAMAGHFTAAGSIMVARDETGIEVFFDDGSSQRIPEAGFEKPYKKLLATLSGHGLEKESSE